MREFKIKAIKPIFTQLVTTCYKYSKDEVGFLEIEGAIKEYQKVLSVGSAVRDIEVGDWVQVDSANYMKKQYDANSLQNEIGNNKTIRVDMPVYDINGEEVMLLDQNDIKMALEGEWEEKSDIVIPDGKIIVN